jgi:PrtD family type I secretion system ABC transporter
MLLQSLLLGAGAWLALHEAVSGGAMIAVSIIAGRALVPIEQIVGQWRVIAAALEATKRCRELLSGDVNFGTGIALPSPAGKLCVKGLYVSTLHTNLPVIKGLNFSLEPGDALAVIGPSATGKSTLAKALVGVWPVRAGEIRLDGATLSQWDTETLGKHIGYLPQDAFLFDGTIIDNIARLAPKPDLDAVITAARAAGVHEMILRLEHGYETRVGEGGSALSGGQRQRIALARALYGNPALIVMDEPNANLDASGEAALTEAIRLLREARRTVIVMAHRRSVLAAVNRVLVLDDGRQAAFGPPDKLLDLQTASKDKLDETIAATSRAAHARIR